MSSAVKSRNPIGVSASPAQTATCRGWKGRSAGERSKCRQPCDLADGPGVRLPGESFVNKQRGTMKLSWFDWPMVHTSVSLYAYRSFPKIRPRVLCTLRRRTVTRYRDSKIHSLTCIGSLLQRCTSKRRQTEQVGPNCQIGNGLFTSYTTKICDVINENDTYYLRPTCG